MFRCQLGIFASERASIIKMPKFSSQRRKKRKFFMEIALQIVQELTKKSRLLSKALRVGYVNPQTAFHMIKAKRRNLVETSPSITGFRFCDMEVLSSVFSLPRCGECGDFSLLFMEDNLKRKGCASTLRLLCEQCGWKHSFIQKSKERVFK